VDLNVLHEQKSERDWREHERNVTGDERITFIISLTSEGDKDALLPTGAPLCIILMSEN